MRKNALGRLLRRTIFDGVALATKLTIRGESNIIKHLAQGSLDMQAGLGIIYFHRE